MLRTIRSGVLTEPYTPITPDIRETKREHSIKSIVKLEKINGHEIIYEHLNKWHYIDVIGGHVGFTGKTKERVYELFHNWSKRSEK
jgi:hypothetical protein